MLYSTKNFLYKTKAAHQTTTRADIAATHGQPKPPRQRAAATEGQPTSCYQGCRQCCFSGIPDTLVFLLWIPDFAPGRRPGPEMSVDFDQTVALKLKIK